MSLADANLALGRWLRRFALYSFAGDIYDNRRVLEVGCDTGAGCAYLADSGATSVIGVDVSADSINIARSRFSKAGIEFRCEDAAELNLEDSSVDCIFVPEGAKLLRRYKVIDELRRVLAKGGDLIWSAPSADRASVSGGASYFEFAERLEDQFGPVRMIAQAPFTAISLADYESGESAVTLETALLDLGEDAGQVTEYVALAGPGAEGRRGFFIAQTPIDDGLIAARRSLSGTNQVDGIFSGDELEAERRLRKRAESQVAALEAQEGAVVHSASPRDQTVVLEPAQLAAMSGPPADDRGSIDDDPQRVAAAFAEHARRVSALEEELEEARAYQEELLDDIGELREAERQRSQREPDRRGLEEVVRRLRDDLARREGEIVGVRARASERTQLADAELAKVRKQLLNARLSGGISSEYEAKLRSVDEKLATTEALLADQDVLLAELEHGLKSLLSRAHEDNLQRAERSALNAQQQHQLNSLAGEIGSREAEITLLTVGLKSLRARISHVARKLEPLCERLQSSDNAAMASVLREIVAELRRYAK
jgi:hypothetical protein